MSPQEKMQLLIKLEKKLSSISTSLNFSERSLTREQINIYLDFLTICVIQFKLDGWEQNLNSRIQMGQIVNNGVDVGEQIEELFLKSLTSCINVFNQKTIESVHLLFIFYQLADAYITNKPNQVQTYYHYLYNYFSNVCVNRM